MGRARRARRIAAQAAYGGGALGALGALGFGVIRAEGALARRMIGTPTDTAPDDDGSYGAGPGDPWRILVLGDSSAAGLGAETAQQTVGGIVASGVAALTGRRVDLRNEAVVGAESAGLAGQLAAARDAGFEPHLVLVMVGANDVTHRIERSVAVRHLEHLVRELVAEGVEVVVGTCPDLGTIEPVPQPLRLLARRWSRDLAAAQTVAVVEAGGRTVSLGDLLGPEFSAEPHVMFSRDRFHPSPAGYARAAAAILPSVYAALRVWETGELPQADRPRWTNGVGPVAVAAGHAVRDPGTEVSPVEVGGEQRGPRGRWAILRRRRPTAVAPLKSDDTPPEPVEAATGSRPGAASGQA